MGLPFDSANITYMLKEPSGGTAGRSHLWTLVTWCDDYDICIKAIDYTWLRSNATTSSSLPCSSGTLLTVTICTDTWEYIPSSGGGGGTGGNSGGNTGGGGSSGGSTPPGCEGGVPANRSSLYQNPCEPDGYRLMNQQLIKCCNHGMIVLYFILQSAHVLKTY